MVGLLAKADPALRRGLKESVTALSGEATLRVECTSRFALATSTTAAGPR